jgi:hypothetical protein
MQSHREHERVFEKPEDERVCSLTKACLFVTTGRMQSGRYPRITPGLGESLSPYQCYAYGVTGHDSSLALI